MLKNHFESLISKKKKKNQEGEVKRIVNLENSKERVEWTIGFVSKIADLPVYPGCQSRNVRFKGYKTYLGEILGRQ